MGSLKAVSPTGSGNFKPYWFLLIRLFFVGENEAGKIKSLLFGHEICHSWAGNLVTNKNWKIFWINEGITDFIQRKLTKMMFGEELTKKFLNGKNEELNDDKENLIIGT